MKKTAILLTVLLIVSLLALSSCELLSKIPVIGDLINKPCESHVDDNGDYICDKCEAELEKNDTPCEHKDEGKDHKCDLCEAEIGEHKAAEGSHDCAYCGAAISECSDADKDHKCDVCGANVGEHVAVDGGHDCEYCGKPASEHADNDGDNDCDACGYVMFEDVKYSFNVSDVEKGVRSEDEINGKFTIVSGTEVRDRTKSYDGVEYNKSVKMAAGAIKVSVPGTGKLKFIVQNGSSGAAVQYVKITDPKGEESQVEIPGTDDGSPMYLVEIDVTEGDWTVARVSGTIDVYYLELNCKVAVAPEKGFELVSAGRTNFLVGDELDISKLQLNAIYENGKTDSLDLTKVTVNTSAVDMTKSGVYDITVTYKEYAPITYQVSVYAPESIKLGFDAIEKLSSNTSAGNGVYFNHSFKELYFVGDSLDTKGLTVIVVGKCGDDSLEFRVDDYEIGGFDSSEWGEKILTISAKGVSATTAVHVTDSVPAPDDNGEILVLVDPNYLGLRGAKSGVYYVVSTIQQALDFLAKADASTPKELNIAPGYYNEKLEITIPNLTIIGCGDSAADVVIEWDSLYGLVDAGGFTHTTDSTATVAIRESAVYCVIENVTISNYWNTQERLDEAGLDIERNLALLVQADRFIMKDSRLLAIQDTLELFTGRQYFENVFISGYTDFIFGTNNTTYFKNCTIHVIDTGKDDNGTAGYVTAFKGCNKDAKDAIVYGAIFDGCKFTADEGVTAGKTAIGRTWGAYAAVAVINSELGEHISVDGYDKSENKNKRYISMNGIHPTDTTVQFVEYNNTGAGAITEPVAGMRMLTAEEAAKYADFSIIFGTTNGMVKYLDPWDPTSTEIMADDRTYYFFNGGSSATGTSYTYDQSLNGSTGTFGDIAIDATAGKVEYRSGSKDTQLNTGATLTFSVKAGTTVTIVSYPGYGYYTLNGVENTANDTNVQYFAEDTEVVLIATKTAYLFKIIIDPGSDAPDENPVISENTVLDFSTAEGLAAVENNPKVTMTGNIRFNNNEIQITGTISFQVKAGTVVSVTPYENDQYASFKIYAEGKKDDIVYNSMQSVMFDKDCTVIYEGLENNYLVRISIECPLGEGKYVFGGSTEDGDVTGILESIPGMSVTGTCKTHSGGAQLGADSQIIFIAPALATITVQGYDKTYGQLLVLVDGVPVEMNENAQYVFYCTSSLTIIIEAKNAGTDEAPDWSKSYITYIKVEIPTVIEENTEITFGSAGNYKDSVIDFSGITIVDNENSNNNSQIKNGSFSFAVKKGAEVTVHGYAGYTSYNLGDGEIVYENMTNKDFTYEAWSDCVITISHTTGNNYFYSIDIYYPVVFDEDTTIDLSKTGASIQGTTGTYNGLEIDATNGKFDDNEGGWTQVNKGTVITLNVADGAQVSVSAYYSADNFTVEILNGVCTITCVADDYLDAIKVSY